MFGSHRFRNFSVTNPFLLPNRSGVRYYADTDLMGGHLSSMLTNAQKTSEYMTDYLVKRNSKYLPAVTEIMALEDAHHATLAARREFLENFIAKLCDKYYGSGNKSLLPEFVPVTLKEVKSLAEGETYKKAPTHVAFNMLKSLKGEDTVYQGLLNPEHENKTDEEFRQMCERTWFYFGDHKRDIQGRMTILRDYMPEIRENLEKNRRKFKPLVYKPLTDDEMKVIQAAIRKHRQEGNHYAEIIDKCMAVWEQEFAQERLEAGPPANDLLHRLVDQLSLQILERSPDSAEAEEYVALTKNYINKLGNLKAIQKLIQTMVCCRANSFTGRSPASGESDQYGRRNAVASRRELRHCPRADRSEPGR